MAQMLIRNLDARTVARLKARARRHGQSLAAEVREVLNSLAEAESPAFRRALAEVHSLFDGRHFDDSAELIREDRDR